MLLQYKDYQKLLLISLIGKVGVVDNHCAVCPQYPAKEVGAFLHERPNPNRDSVNAPPLLQSIIRLNSCATLLKCGTATENQLSFKLSYYRHISFQEKRLSGFTNGVYDPHIYIRFWSSSIERAIPGVRFIVEGNVGTLE